MKKTQRRRKLFDKTRRRRQRGGQLGRLGKVAAFLALVLAATQPGDVDATKVKTAADNLPKKPDFWNQVASVQSFNDLRSVIGIGADKLSKGAIEATKFYEETDAKAAKSVSDALFALADDVEQGKWSSFSLSDFSASLFTDEEPSPAEPSWWDSVINWEVPTGTPGWLNTGDNDKLSYSWGSHKDEQVTAREDYTVMRANAAELKPGTKYKVRYIKEGTLPIGTLEQNTHNIVHNGSVVVFRRKGKQTIRYLDEDAEIAGYYVGRSGQPYENDKEDSIFIPADVGALDPDSPQGGRKGRRKTLRRKK